MFPLTSPHTASTNTSNANIGSALSGQSESGRVVHDRGLNDDGTPDNSIERVYFKGGEVLNEAARWLTKQVSGAIERVDATLRFPVAEAASAPLFRLHGRVLRVDDLPESLEQEPDVIKLHDPYYRVSESDLQKSRVHKMVAQQLEKLIGRKEVRKLRALIVSDHNHNSGRSKLLVMHLKRLAIKEKIELLCDGQTIGKEKQDIQSLFVGVDKPGLYRGLEADLPVTLTNLVNVHHVLFTLESVPGSNIDKRRLAGMFMQFLYSYTESEIYREAHKNFEKDFWQSSKKDRALLAPFIGALSSIPPGTDAKIGCDKLAEWYRNASAQDRVTARLFFKKVISQLVNSLHEQSAASILAYLDDPQKKFGEADKALIDLRHAGWDKVIKDTWIEVDKRAQGNDEEPIPIVVFGGRAHDEHVNSILSELEKNSVKPEAKMKSEL